MIEIIKHAQKKEHENKKYRLSCNYCGCVFTCESCDWTHGVIVGHGQRDDVISCPECGNKFYLSCILSLGEGIEIT